MEVMDCDHLVVTGDRRVGIVGMVGTVGELGGAWVMVWDEGLGVSGEDVVGVGIGGVQVNACYRWEGSSWERLGRSYWRIYYVGTV